MFCACWRYLELKMSSSPIRDSDDEDAALSGSDNEISWEELKDDGNLAFQHGLYAESIEKYTEALKLKDDEPVLYANRAMAYLKLKQFKQAESDAQKCIDLDKSFLKAYDRGAMAAANLGKFSEALHILEKGIAQANGSPKDKPVELALLEKQKMLREVLECATAGRAEIAAGKTTEALKHVSTGTALLPDCAPLHLLLAEARALSDPAQALQALKSLQDTHADHPDFIYVRALATYFLAGPNGNKNASVLCKEALELDPEHAQCKSLFKKCRAAEQHRNAGNDAYKRGAWQEAVDAYSAALAVDPRNRTFNGLVYGNRSAAKLEMKQYGGALSDVNNAIQNGNDPAKLFARRSKIHEALEMYEDAQRDMEKAAEMDPPNYEREVEVVKKRIKLAKRIDWYKILGVPRTATADEMKRAYKKRALELHPDKWANAAESDKVQKEKEFKQLGEAFAILSDPEKRRLYDAGRIDNETDHSTHGGRGGGHPFAGGGVDISEMFNMFGGMGGGFGGMGGMPRGRRGGGPGFHFHSGGF